jgi:hypothetical protein
MNQRRAIRIGVIADTHVAYSTPWFDDSLKGSIIFSTPGTLAIGP